MESKDNKKIEFKIPMIEILKTLGIPTTLNELRSGYKLNVDTTKVDKLENEINILEEKAQNEYKKIKRQKEQEISNYWNFFSKQNWYELQNIICNYEDVFDKKVFILHMGRLLEYDSEKLRRSLEWDVSNVEPFVHLIDINIDFQKPANEILGKIKIQKRRAAKCAKEWLKGEDVIDTSEVPDATDQRAPTDINCLKIKNVTSSQFIGIQTTYADIEINSKSKLNQIETQIGLEKILNYLFPKDLFNLCRYENLANKLVDEIKKDNNKENITLKSFKKIIEENIQFFDIDKMLMISAERYFNSEIPNNREIKTGKLYLQKIENILEVITQIELLIENKEDTKVISTREEKEINIEDIINTINDLYSHFIGGKYYDSKEYKQIRKKILVDNKFELSDLSSKEFKNFNFTQEEISSLINNNSNALEYLITNGILTKEEINYQIEWQESFSNEQLLGMILSDLIDKEKILELYMLEKITLDNMCFVKLNANKKILKKIGMICQNSYGKMIDGLVNQNQLMELYTDSEKKQEFEKYRKLYILLVMEDLAEEIKNKKENYNNEDKINEIENKIVERKNIAGEQLLSIQEEKLDRENIFILYNKGLITIKNLIDFECLNSSEDATKKTKELLFLTKIKPRDVKELYNQKILTEKLLKDFCENEKINILKRLLFIECSFNGNDKTNIEIREKLLKNMPNFSNKNNNTVETLFKEVGTNIENTTNLFNKINLIGKIDSEYSYKILNDEIVEVYLPNFGVYVLEILLNKNGNYESRMPTFILTEGAYQKYKAQIFEENEQETILNIKEMLKLKKDKISGVKKIIHTGWTNSLLKYFGMKESNKYTEDEKNEIYKLATKF